ncbi:MAG TPA: hypothetical protein VN732_06085 [Solirubrobacterales bacterium]|nr:hypothetical protein [Solirubrobacterales bacterium]
MAARSRWRRRLEGAPRREEEKGYRRRSRIPCTMRAMAFIWGVILIGGITYFSIIGLSHH